MEKSDFTQCRSQVVLIFEIKIIQLTLQAGEFVFIFLRE